MEIIKVLGISLVCALAFSVCDTLVAHWAKNGSHTALAVAMILAPVGYLLFGYLNTRVDLSIAGGLVNASIVLFTALAGYFLFGETDIKRSQIVGLVFIMTGVFLALRA